MSQEPKIEGEIIDYPRRPLHEDLRFAALKFRVGEYRELYKMLSRLCPTEGPPDALQFFQGSAAWCNKQIREIENEMKSIERAR